MHITGENFLFRLVGDRNDGSLAGGTTGMTQCARVLLLFFD